MSQPNSGPSGSYKPRPLIALLLITLVVLLFNLYMVPRRDEAPPGGEVQPVDGGKEGAPGRDDPADRPDRPERPPPGEAERDDEEIAKVERPQRPVETRQLEIDGQLRLALSSLGIEEVVLPGFAGRQEANEELVLMRDLENRSAPASLQIDRMEAAGGAPPVDSLPDLSREPWELTVVDQNAVTLRNEIDETGAVGGGAGLELVLELRTSPAPETYQYRVDVTVTFRNRGPVARVVDYTLHGPGGLSSEATRGVGTDLTVVYGLSPGTPPKEGSQLVSAIDEKSGRWFLQARGGGVTPRIEPSYVGLMNNYFVAVLAKVDSELRPDPGDTIEVFAERFSDPRHFEQLARAMFPDRDPGDLAPNERAELLDDVADTAQVGLKSSVEIDPAGEYRQSYLLYMGPRDNDVLGAYEELGLTNVNDYGWFSAIVRLFMGVLRGFHWLTGSWGFSIVCLTLIVRTCLHPINRKQQIGMSKYQKQMQKIQPLVKELQKKYEKDRMKMHQEMQKLFKEHNISHTQMAGGCLMIFLQLPIWIGLIRTLDYSIDLRQAPFLWWDDLSRPDHLYGPLPFEIPFLGDYLNLLPILYVALMIVQQKMMPKPTDPQAQQTQKMMSFMMIAFGFIFYRFPSGLMVYFITSALFGLCESRLIKRIIAREEEAGGAPPKPAVGGDSGPASAASAASSGPLYSSSKVGKRRKPTKAERQKAKGQPRF